MKKIKLSTIITTAIFLIVTVFSCLFFVGFSFNKVNAKTVQNKETYSAQNSLFKVDNASAYLNTLDKKLYDYVSSEFDKIIAGEKSSAKITISDDELISWGVKTRFTNEDFGTSNIVLDDVTSTFCAQFSLRKIFDALLIDNPFTLCWFDKEEGYVTAISGTENSANTVVYVKNLVFMFSVIKSYQPSSYNEDDPTINLTAINTAKSSLIKANEIVEEAKDFNDYKKLEYYKQKICELVVYDESVLDPSYSGGYSNVWQMVNVFDGNTSTNVVCEGYSKAFKYLCDKTNFDDDKIKCYTVTGDLISQNQGGGHMWNIVTYSDGKNYLVDVTNSDGNGFGKNGGLFMKGYDSGNLTNGYVFLGATYRYDSNGRLFNLFGTGEDSVLKLSSTDCAVPSISIEISVMDLSYDGEEITVGFTNADICYGVLGNSLQNASYNFTAEFFENKNGAIGNKLLSNPKNAGNYFVKVTAKHKIFSSDMVSKTVGFTIKKAPLGISSLTATSRAYDGTKKVVLTDIILLGILSSDNVYVDESATILGEISSKNVGTYTSVFVENLVLKGEDASNYELNSQTVNLSENLVVTKAVPTGEALFYSNNPNDVVNNFSELSCQIDFTDASGNKILGTIKVYDSLGNEVNESSSFSKTETYTYVFTPNDANFDTVSGTVSVGKPYPNGGRGDIGANKYSSLIAFAIVGGTVVLAFTISLIKRKKK